MANYKGRRPGTRRIVVYHASLPHGQKEWVVEGSKSEGAAFETQKLLELQAQAKAASEPPPAPSFFELSKAYTAAAVPYLKASTWDVRKYHLVTLVQHFGSVRVDALTLGHVDAFKQARLAEVTPVAINNELRVLSVVLNWGRANQYPVSPVKWKRLKSRACDRCKFFTADEVGRILHAARSTDREMLRLLLFLANTGCRKCESLAARWHWFDWEAGLLRIEATKAWQPKSGRSRDVPISDALRAAFASDPHTHPDWVFPSEDGTRFRRFPEHRFRAVMKAAGVRGHPHMFRHTYASHFLAHTPDLHLLAEILGHSAIYTTLIYSHLLPGRLQRAKDAVSFSPPTLALTLAVPAAQAKI